MGKHLHKKDTHETAEDLIDVMGWWERKGNSVDIDQDLKDLEEFDKAKRLAQLWHETNMPTRVKEKAVEEVSDLFEWVRKKNKDFDLDALKSKKVDNVRELFH